MRTRFPLVVAAAAAALVGVTLARSGAAAHGPYVVVRDDGSLSTPNMNPNPDIARQNIMKQYRASGAPVPDVLSVWTTFPMWGDVYQTIFDPVANDVTGIGLEQEYGGDGTFPSDTPPLRSMLFHNDVLAIGQRAKLQGAPADGFADYLFLLELSHNWGPEISIPGADGGAASDELIGFPFHWSFWNDMGGSPAGGNKWMDNGDGTFTADGQNPGMMTYSMLDLYLMGLADASEVQPFGVLENAVPPSTLKDPFTGQAYAASSFPWFGSTPFTVTATRRTLTIADVVAANGTRSPAYGASPKTFKLGIALVVGANDTDAAIAQAETTFDPIAPTFAPAFAQATRGRGTMQIVTAMAVADAGADSGGGDDAGDDAGDDGGGGGAAPDASAGSGGGKGHGGCAMGGARSDDAGVAAAAAGIAIAALLALARRRRYLPWTRTSARKKYSGAVFSTRT